MEEQQIQTQTNSAALHLQHQRESTAMLDLITSMGKKFTDAQQSTQDQFGNIQQLMLEDKEKAKNRSSQCPDQNQPTEPNVNLLSNDPNRFIVPTECSSALVFAQQYFMQDSTSIEAEVLEQLDISTIDPSTFSRNKQKYVDVKAFTAAMCKDDPSIATDLTAALSKTGTEKRNLLMALRKKLGQGSHREKQLGDAMLLYLVSHSDTSTGPEVRSVTGPVRRRAGAGALGRGSSTAAYSAGSGLPGI